MRRLWGGRILFLACTLVARAEYCPGSDVSLSRLSCTARIWLARSDHPCRSRWLCSLPARVLA